MPAPTVVSDFLECVRKSGVVEPRRLDDYLARLGDDAPATPTQMADALVRDGLLTRFQAEQLLRGRWRNFILCGKYTILEPLGAGGMGTVYLCSHNIMRRPVAIKVLPAAQAEDPGAVERFHREAEAVAKLGHPNIVGAYDVDRDGKFHFLVMEYVDGVNLQDLVKRSGPLDPIRAAHYVHQAALGLEHAHAAGLIHRDIKPANLLVDRTGVVKILDLGLARFFRDGRESVTAKYDGDAVLGTADYLAPEQAVDSHNVDIRCDIYSLGITFYFLLSGRSPFQEGSVAEKLIWHQVREPAPIRQLRPETPPGLAEVLEKMIAKEPGRRYQTPAEVAAALAPFTQAPIDPPSAEELPPITPGARRAGVTDSNGVLPRLPSPSTPTPSPARAVSTDAHRGPLTPQPAGVQDEVSTRKDGRTAMFPLSPPTMISPPASLPAQGDLPPAPAEPPVEPPRRWRRTVALVGVGVLVLAVVAVGVGLSLWRPSPRAAVVVPPPPPPPAPPAVNVANGPDGWRIHAAAYDAHLGPDGCLDSFRVGDVEFLKPGEQLSKEHSTARGAYFFSDQPPVLGAVPLPNITQPTPGVVLAAGDKYSVKYEFSPGGVALTVANNGDQTAPFFILLDSGAVATMVNGKGELWTVPMMGAGDPKWTTTTWAAGRSALRISRTDADGVKLWGPFGQAKAQVWGVDVTGKQSAAIRLEASFAPEPERPTPPPGGVVLFRQGETRSARTERYEAMLTGDGSLPSLRVGGVEFIESKAGFLRGAYFFYQGAPQSLPFISQSGPATYAAAGMTAGMICEFGPDTITLWLENHTDAPMSFYIVLDPAVTAVRNDKGEWLKPPFGAPTSGPDRQWGNTTWLAGRAKITISGGSKMWGQWLDKYQVWEVYLDKKNEKNAKRQVVIETGVATEDELRGAAAAK